MRRSTGPPKSEQLQRRLSQLVAATAAGEAEAKVLDRLGSHRIDLYHAEQHDPALFAEAAEASPARRGLASIDAAAVEQFARDGFLVVEVRTHSPTALSTRRNNERSNDAHEWSAAAGCLLGAGHRPRPRCGGRRRARAKPAVQ